MISSKQQHGGLLVMVLVFGGIFFTIVAAFSGFVIKQSQLQEFKLKKEQSLAIAEAGLNYYRWYLAHNPDDVTHGTGSPGPYVFPYTDSASTTLGYFSLDIASTTFCGVVSNIDIYSTGYTVEDPSVSRTVYGRYALPTVAEFAYIINSNVWAGGDRTIIGPYHANGGIRMDGSNNSTVTSGQETWTCTDSFGCNPDQIVDGVFGAGPDSSLWTFPSPPINFTGLTVDLSTMRDRAENAGGIYIPSSGEFGYRVSLQSDGTIDVYSVDQTYDYFGYSTADGWQGERHVIDDDDFYASYTINADCPLIFVEDKVWLEGEVNQKVTIAAADTDTPGIDPSMILNDNITYTSSSSGLLAVAEDDILIGLVVPDDMDLNGIFIAQNGHFGRNHYKTTGNYDVLSFHNAYVCRDSLSMNGTIVSNGRVGTKWTGYTCGGYSSGFETRYNSYDRDLVDNPPPLAPRTSDDYKFVEWRDVD